MDTPPFDLTLDQAAVVLAVAQGAMVRMWERDVPDMPFGASIPRAALTAATADIEPVPEVPNVLRCIECHGWVVLHVECYEDCLRVERHIRPPHPEDDE